MWNWDKLVSQVFFFLKLLLGNFKMSSFKLSFVVITRVLFFVALMSMQLIVTSAIEGAAHTNENLLKLRKSRFLVSNSMEGGSREKANGYVQSKFFVYGRANLLSKSFWSTIQSLCSWPSGRYKQLYRM
jgi:hypothetical protein